jgi:dTDP-4-dehydrorhamnose 3,5-epimerase
MGSAVNVKLVDSPNSRSSETHFPSSIAGAAAPSLSSSDAMKVQETDLPGVLLLEPTTFIDHRGFFTEVFHERRWRELGLPTVWKQDNRSRSYGGVVRGLHYQLPGPQGKLISVLHGEIFDVAVDIRRGSPTFGRWFATRLNGEIPRSMWLPPGIAHGFCALSDTAEVWYKCDAFYAPGSDRGILWNDPALAIPWPVSNPVLSDKDRRLPTLEALMQDSAALPVYEMASAASA